MTDRAHYTRNPAPWIAGTSDIGLKHQTSQDALWMATREDPRSAVVAVADGVSSSMGSERASLAAVETLVDQVLALLKDGLSIREAFNAAFHGAHEAVLSAKSGDEPAACTLIGAHIGCDRIFVANVGDSRAYWLGDDEAAELLSTDDSMAQARILLGMPREEAEQSPQAHAITKWLGRDASDVSPTMTEFVPPTTGWLLLCSDGLWNYASSADAMNSLVQRTLGEHPVPKDATEALVAWAIDQGGRDNITVTLARVEPPR